MNLRLVMRTQRARPHWLPARARRSKIVAGLIFLSFFPWQPKRKPRSKRRKRKPPPPRPPSAKRPLPQKAAVKKKAAARIKAAPKKAPKPTMPPPAVPIAPPGMERIGVITHYYNHLSVAVLKLEKGLLRVGDVIHIKGHTSDFSQPVESMEIDHVHVDEARPGQFFGLRVREHAHGVVYKAKT